MATKAKTIPRSGAAHSAASQVESSLRFDWLMTLLPSWVLIGLYVDGWAHVHIASTLETFFTPWHAMLYTGMLVSLIALLVALVRNHSAGYAWLKSLPAGYELSLVGAILFGMGGVLDMGWHILFGIEVSTEALLSPTHLILAVSGFLLMSGPLRAYLRRAEEPGRWREWLPPLLSLLWIFSLMTFFTQFASPVRTPWAANSLQGTVKDANGWSLGVNGFIVQPVALIGVLLFALRRWPSLPAGAVTLLLGSNIVLMSAQNDQFRFIPAALVGGIAGDFVLAWVKRTPEQGLKVRVFAFAVPVVYSLCYFILLLVTEGTWWKIHLVGGSIVISGLIGWLISYLVFPLPGPGRQAEVL
jgi:hypothetical protein